jgi:hypothetical protein
VFQRGHPNHALTLLQIFPLVQSFASWFFNFTCLDIFWVHVMFILDLLWVWGVCNMLLGMLHEVMSVKYGRLQKKDVCAYLEMCQNITRWKHYEAKGKLGEKIAKILLVLDTLKTLGRFCRNPTLREVWGRHSHSWKWELESPGTLKNLEDDCRGQNTLHWGVLYTVGKVLKCRCPKWPRMSHLDIFSPSYGQKKGRESNW